MNFALATKITSLIAATSGSGVSVVLSSGAVDSVVEPLSASQGVWTTIFSFILNLFGTIFLAISKFALGIIDLIQFIVYKFLGVSFDNNYTGYDPNNPIIKFLSNHTVTVVIRSMLGVAVVLVILFSIYAIIRGEYARAANGTEYSAKRVVARAIRSMFGMVIFPVLFLVIVVLTNAVASSFARALSNNNSAMIGGQVISTSAYSANNWRNYANNNQRIPISINFEDPYNNKTVLSRYTTQELAEVYSSFAGDGRRYYNMFATNDFLTFRQTLNYNNGSLNNSNKYNEFENFVCTAEQYYVMADFMDYALANGLTFYYKPITADDIDWRYVDESVFDRDSKTLTITYRDANKVYALDAAKKTGDVSYTVSYTAEETKLSSPIQDAMTTLQTLLSLDAYDKNTETTVPGAIFKTIEYIEGTINQIQWKTNKVRLKLSANYNNSAWTTMDKILLYEYYRYEYNNSLQEYTLADLENGVDVDLYTIYNQFYRSYTGKYENIGEPSLAATINGHYYKVTQLYENGNFVVDDYGDPVYQIDVFNQAQFNFNQMPDDSTIGVNIPNHGKYSAVYGLDGVELPENLLTPFFVDTTGEKFAEANEETGEQAKYGFPDANGIYREVDRVKAVKNTKSVTFPTKLTNDLQTIYRNLNLEQLVTTGEWLNVFASHVDIQDGEYVASFDTSLISPQGLIFSEIFLGELVESDGSNLGNYMFKSKYTDEQVKAIMYSILGEGYYETTKTTIDYFVDTFNMLFEPLLERILAGENQTMKAGEIESIQLYAYKAYLASVLLSSDSAQFFLNIAKSLIGMYKFNYNLSLAKAEEYSFVDNVLKEYLSDEYSIDGASDTIKYMLDVDSLVSDWKKHIGNLEIDYELVNSILEEYYSDNYSSTGKDGKTKYTVNLQENGIDWKIYYRRAIQTTSGKAEFDERYQNYSFEQYLKETFEETPTYEDINSELVKEISYVAQANKYSSFKDYVRENYTNQSTYEDLPADLVEAVMEAGQNIYIPYVDIIFDEIFNDTIENGYRIDLILSAIKDDAALGDDGYGVMAALGETTASWLTLEDLTGVTYSYDSSKGKNWYSLDEKYHTYSQIKEYAQIAKQINKISLLLLEQNTSNSAYNNLISLLDSKGLQSTYQDKSNITSLITVYHNAVTQLSKQNITKETNSSWPTYLKMFKSYASGETNENSISVGRLNIILSSIASPNGMASIYGDYSNYVNALKNAKNTARNYFSSYIGVIPSTTNADNRQKFEELWNLYKDGVSNNLEDYAKQVENLDWFVAELNASNYSNLAKSVSNLFDLQKVVDNFHKYFITLSERMVSTEMAVKNFNVIVNNHTYELKLTMPTAKLTEYIVGGRYLSSIGFETAYVSNSSWGFLNLGYEDDLPKDGQAEFVLINKFAEKFADVTLQSYYMSNLKNLTESKNNANVSDQTLKQTNYGRMIYNFIVSNGYLEKISPNGTFNSSYTDDNFEKLMSYIIGTEEESGYLNMTMKQFRIAIMNSLRSYQRNTSGTSKQEAQRYICLFNLFCADVKDGIYDVDVTTKGIALRLAGIEDLPDSSIVNLEYQNKNNVGYDENDGDYFIICTLDKETNFYIPFMMTNMGDNDIKSSTTISASANSFNEWKQKYKLAAAITSYYMSTNANTRIAYPVLAKGIVTNDGMPTAIREINGVVEFYRDDLVVRNASDLNLTEYFMTPEVVSSNLNFFSTMINGMAKLFTGKSLVERAYESIPRLSIAANINFPFGVNNSVYSLNSNGLTMDYSFAYLGDVKVENFYDVTKIDYFTLFIAIIALMPIMIKALFGVFGRVLDITLYYVMSPVMFSTIALGVDSTDKKGSQENTQMFTTWWNEIIKKTISIFAYIFAFQVFFILVPYIKENMNIFSDNSAFANLLVFKNFSVDFINNILKLILIICSAYLITEAPKLIADILNQSDGIAEGAQVQANVKSTINEVKNTINGQKAVNTVNFMKESVKDSLGINAIKDAAGQVKAVGAKVASKGAEYYLRAHGVPKDVAKKITKQYANSVKETQEAKKKLRDEKRTAAQSAYLSQIGVGDKDEAVKNINSEYKAVNGWLADHGYRPSDWKDQYKKRKKKNK